MKMMKLECPKKAYDYVLKKKTKQPTAFSNWQTVPEDEVERIARRSTQLINRRVVC